MASFRSLPIVLAVCCVTVIAQDESNVYPTKHPYENDADIPPAWPMAEPSLSFNDDDVGGYVPVYAETLRFFDGTITMDDLPYCPCANGFYMYLYVAVFEIPPMDVPIDWNCTMLEYRFKDADFTGIVAGERVCEIGSCCKEIIGYPKYSDDVPAYEDWLNNRVSGSACEIPHHDMYCIWVGGDFWVNCQEYTPTPSWRFYVIPCYDGHYLFNSACKLFQVEYTISYKKEPPIYYASMTNDQTLSHDAFQMVQDRVCRPNSYYFPSSAVPTDDGSPDDGSSSSPPSDTDEASSAYVWAPIVSILVAFV